MAKFSLLDGLTEELGVSSVTEAFIEDLEDQRIEDEEALEATMDKELSEEDIRAILDDDNDDNEAAEIEEDDEDVQAIADDSLDEDLKSLEAMLAEFEAE